MFTGVCHFKRELWKANIVQLVCISHTSCRLFWDESSVWNPHADEEDQKGATKKHSRQTRASGSTQMPADCFPGRSGRQIGGAGNPHRPVRHFPDRERGPLLDGLL